MRKTVHSSFQNSEANHVYRIYVVISTYVFASYILHSQKSKITDL